MVRMMCAKIPIQNNAGLSSNYCSVSDQDTSLLSEFGRRAQKLAG